jgi:hypothetical protein
MIKAYKRAARKYKKAERIYTRAAKWKFRLFFFAVLIAAWKVIEGVL